MKCLICGKSNEKSPQCIGCSNKQRCKECNILKTHFHKYKNNKIYSTCIESFNKKVKCDFCNKEFNKTYLSKHVERCLINRCLIKKIHLNDNNNEINNDNIKLYNEIDNNPEIDNNMFNRTLIVGFSFCGKTHFFLNE